MNGERARGGRGSGRGRRQGVAGQRCGFPVCDGMRGRKAVVLQYSGVLLLLSLSRACVEVTFEGAGLASRTFRSLAD